MINNSLPIPHQAIVTKMPLPIINRVICLRIYLLRVFLCLVTLASSAITVRSQESGGSSSNAAQNGELSKAKQLETRQNQLLQRFQKLEELFLRMSELEAESNPTHSGLLMQAAQLSKQLGTRQQLLSASDLISRGQLTKAIQEQVAAHENLQKLLELLQSENRGNRIRDERTKLEEIVNELRRLESIQRSLRGRTEAGQDMKQSGADQKNLNEQIESLDNSIQVPEQAKSPKNDKSGENGRTPDAESPDVPDPSSPEASEQGSGDRKQDGQKSDKQLDGTSESSGDPEKQNPSENSGEENSSAEKAPNEKLDSNADDPSEKNQGQEPADGSTQPEEKNAPPNKPEDQQNSEKQPANTNQDKASGSDANADDSSEESEGGSGQQSKPKSKEEQAKSRVQKAKARMKKAQQELESNQRDEAVKEQRAAEKELREAVEELEKVLRQLREEEIERSLVDLETRIRKMHELQKSVRIETERLDKLEGSSRERTLEIQANKLVIEQTKIVMEGQRAMLLLQDEGSSTAFPEALDQVVRDAQLVSKRLAALNVSGSTQAIEDEIIASLEELLTSLKQVQKDKEEEKKKAQQEMGGGSPPPPSGEQPLVDKLAELRLLKTLQLRINRRTQSLAKQLDISEDSAEQVEAPELREELSDLAERQLNILEVTREILIKENQE